MSRGKIKAKRISIQPPGDTGLRALERQNRALEVQLREAENDRARTVRELATLTAGTLAERDLRRAALNLMEDAVAARRAERIENEERRRVEAELRDADRRKDEFLATLAHELRGPLAPVRNALNLLRLGTPGQDTHARLVTMMDRQVGHMVRLIDDLLDISRITRGRVELRLEKVELGQVVEAALEASMPLIEAARHRLVVKLPQEPVFFEADSIRITQVITNLLNNASKYTRPGGQIWVTAEVLGDEVILRVRDTGVGIPAEKLPLIFDLFTQLDRTYDDSRGGVGIGLTLARSLVQLHSGRIDAHSDGPDQGSTFRVALPLGPPGNRTGTHAEGVVTEPVPVSRVGTSKVPRRILVVDDNEESAETLGMLLEMGGDEVRSVNDGRSALETIESFCPTIVLMDIGMPQLDGYEVARRTRKTACGQAATLVALTGWGQREDRERSRAAGFDHHLVKPVSIDTLEALFASLDGSAVEDEKPGEERESSTDRS